MTVTVRNTDTHARVWPSVIRADNGATLALEPGEEADVVAVPSDAPHLAVRKPKKTAATEAESTNPEVVA